MDFLFLAQQCAPAVSMDTMRRVVQVESSYNPYAIGVVGGRLERQPRNKEEAIATAKWLERDGYNYSVGLAQINKHNFAKFGLTFATAFDACPNLRAGAEILKECFIRANRVRRDEQTALRDAFSCYSSGSFVTGYKQGYVLKVVNAGQVGVTVPMALQARTYPDGAPRAASVVPSQKKSFTEPRPVLAAPGQVAPAAVASSPNALLF